MDLHDYLDVAENYDVYVKEIEKVSIQFSEESVVNFHIELAKQYGQNGVLDLGCGTGVTLFPLINKGYQVTAVDISQSMIDVVNKKLSTIEAEIASRADCICAGMESFKASGKYSLGFVARTGFMHILDGELQRKALENIREHLVDGGILSFNTFYPNHEFIASQMKRTLNDYYPRLEFINKNGNREKLYNSGTYDPESQILSGVWLFEEYNDKNEIIGKRERPLRLRYTFKKEMEYLFELCGFEVIRVYGDYCKDEAKYPGHIIWVARKR